MRRPAETTSEAPEVFRGGGRSGALCRELEWAETPLGPVRDWPPELRTAAGLVLAAPTPMMLLGGPELVQIHNDAFGDLVGWYDTERLGRPTRECWPEGWEFSASPCRQVLEGGEAVRLETRPLAIDRGGRPAALGLTLAYTPVPDGTGGTGGVLLIVEDTTERRRLGPDGDGDRLGAELEDERVRRTLALEAGHLGDWELDLATEESPRRSLRHDQIFGYTEPRADWSFDIFLEHVHSEDRVAVRSAFQTALERGAPWDFECRIHRVDGALRWIWARGESFPDVQGRPARMLGIVADVTERKEAQEAVRRYAEQLRGLADAALAIHALQDVGQVLDTVTEQARALIGAHQAVTSLTIDRTWTQAINSVSLSDRYADWRGYDETPNGSGIYRLVAETNRSLRMTQAELEAHPAWRGFGRHSDRHPPMRGWLAVPLVGRDDQNIGLIQLSDRYEGDFTEADEAILVQLAHMAATAVENVRLYRDAQQANQAKSEFLATMSHELRTPLNAVGGYVELLELGVYGPLTDQQRSSLRRIAANQRHLLTLINDILAFARLEAGRIEFDLQPLSARDTIAGLKALFAPQAEAKGLVYRIDGCDRSVRFEGDGERVRQILLNLVSNAIKFTPPGGSVTLSCTGTDDSVDIRVQDSGPGIPEEEHERIFDPFQQVGRRLSQPRDGVGLGLAISRDLARAMNGQLTVESTPGKGSTFTLRLPRASD